MSSSASDESRSDGYKTEGLPANDSSGRMETFLSLISQHQRRLHVFVSSLIPNPVDADDVMQETYLVLWREFPRFEPGTNFPGWACTVALHQVMAWRKRRQRDRLVFSDAFLSAVSRELMEAQERQEERSRVLSGCIEQMPSHHQELLRLRYTEGQTVEAIAGKLNRTTEAVYRMLSRIRCVLFECTSRALAQRGTT